MKTETIAVSTRISMRDYQIISGEVKKGKALSTSEYLRQVLREKIESLDV